MAPPGGTPRRSAHRRHALFAAGFSSHRRPANSASTRTCPHPGHAPARHCNAPAAGCRTASHMTAIGLHHDGRRTERAGHRSRFVLSVTWPATSTATLVTNTSPLSRSTACRWVSLTVRAAAFDAGRRRASRPWWRPMRSRVPMRAEPGRSCSARLAVFSGKMPDWIVQIPAASVDAIRARSRARPTPGPGRRGGRRRSARRPRRRRSGRRRGTTATQPTTARPSARRGRRTGARAAWRRRTPAQVGAAVSKVALPLVDAELVDRQDLVGVLGEHRHDRDARRERRWSCRDRDAELGEQAADAALDAVADGAHASTPCPAGSSSSQSRYRLPGKNGHASPQPMVMTTSDACTASTVSTFGTSADDVYADLCHRLDDGGVDRVGGGGAGRADLYSVPGEVGQERGGHLGAAGVVDADEQHRHGVVWGGSAFHGRPVSVAAHQRVQMRGGAGVPAMRGVDARGRRRRLEEAVVRTTRAVGRRRRRRRRAGRR